MRRLGVDPGERRIGLALSDEDGRVAMPLRTVVRQGDGAEAVRAIAEEARRSEVCEIVVGLPLALDGTEGISARRSRAFAARVGRLASVPVVMWDERLTTAAAERSLREAGVRGKRRREVVDQAAATLLLQTYLDHLEHREAGGSTWDPETEPPAPAAPPRGRAARRSRGARAPRR